DLANRRRNSADLPFPGCVGPLRYQDRSALDRELTNLKATANKAKPVDVFMTAPSPGILTRFIINLHYPTEDAYVAALADVIKTEYRAIVEAGFAADRCARPRFCAQQSVSRVERRRVPQDCRAQHRSAQRGDSRLTCRAHAIAHLLGQLRGP